MTDGAATASVDERELLLLTVRHLDRSLSEADTERLSAALRADPEHRRRFVAVCLHATLAREAALERRQRGATAFRRRPLRWALGITATAAAAALLAWFRPWPISAPPGRAAALGPDARNRVAIVTSASGAEWARDSLPLVVGSVLPPGRIELRAGKVQLDLFGGAKLSLVGPTTLDLVSPRRAYLHAGSAGARVHDEAIGFTLDAPGTKVFDLGTEFALSASPSGRNELQVLRGEVEASVIGEDGATLRSALVKAERGATIDVRSAAIHEQPAPPSEAPLAPVETPAPLALPISERYVDAVRQSRPIAYWRFERIRDGIVDNEISSQPPLRVSGPLELSRGAGNHVAVFSAEGPEGHLVTTEPLRGVDPAHFSIEVWANPEAVRRMTLVSLLPPPVSLERPGLHVAFLELRALEDSISHPPGVVRFVHRWPPSATGGTNAFSAEPYRPQAWQHLVAVRAGGSVKLFVDGRLVRGVAVTQEGSAPRPLEVLVGLLPEWKAEERRRFVGRLDELAIYAHGLGAEEIRRHYEAGLAAAAP